MPDSIGQVHVSVPLSNVAVHYQNPEFVADKIFPVVKVARDADKYYVFGKEELRRVNSERALGGPAGTIGWNPTTATYSAEEYALRHLIPDRIKANADPPVNVEINTVKKLTKSLQLDWEKRVQAVVQSTTYMTNYGAISTGWDASSGQNPEADVDTAKDEVRKNAGVIPNTIVMSYGVVMTVKRWMKSTAYTMYKEYFEIAGLPKKIWDLDLVVAGSIENTAIEGQTETIEDIWNDNVLVCYVDPNPTIDDSTISLGWTFRSRGLQTKRYREDSLGGEWFEVSMIQDEKLVTANCGYLLTDALQASS